jgi:chromosome segregation ATPase
MWRISAAEVTITLKNCGHEAFRPEEYGSTITITRSFTQNGSSSYKIKNQQGKIVSNKRDELSAILDHFMIDVDNPMNILTQGGTVSLITKMNADFPCRSCPSILECLQPDGEV